MSIFGRRTPVTESVTVEEYQGHVDGSLAGLQTILAESSQESFQIRAGLYISDVIMEESVLEGSAQPEVLLESLVKGTFTRIKDMFEKLWAKVKAWFAKVKRSLNLLFSSGQEFIKKFKTEIQGKAVKGFSYEGYVYTLAAGSAKADAKKKVLKETIESSVGFDLSRVRTDDQASDIKGATGKHKDSFNLSEEKQELVKKLGHDEMSAVLKEVAKSFRNDKEAKETIDEFKGNSKEVLIELVDGAKAGIKEIENTQKDLDDQFNRVLSSVKAAQSKIEGEKAEGDAATARSRAITFATHKYNMAQYAITLISSLAGVQVDAVKEAAKHSESVLKSFLRFKPAKEGFVPATEGSVSILESAMKHI
jgi:hypothetical protein